MFVPEVPVLRDIESVVWGSEKSARTAGFPDENLRSALPRNREFFSVLCPRLPDLFLVLGCSLKILPITLISFLEELFPALVPVNTLRKMSGRIGGLRLA